MKEEILKSVNWLDKEIINSNKILILYEILNELKKTKARYEVPVQSNNEAEHILFGLGLSIGIIENKILEFENKENNLK